MSVYIATHKSFTPPHLDEGYIPLQVGAALHPHLGFHTDDVGEEISEKNPNYCELTGLYWVWKNDTGSDIKGLVHYRRYFTTSQCSTSQKGFLSSSEIAKTLENYDIILPKREWLKQNAWDEYHMLCGKEQDLHRVEQIIQRQCPEYLPAFHQYFRGNRSHLFNMMICKREVFDAYCQWLFDILFALEQEVDLSDYTPYQQRIYGFMSERLLNIWVLHHQLRVKEYRTVNTELSTGQRMWIFLRRWKNRGVYFWKNKSGNGENV